MPLTKVRKHFGLSLVVAAFAASACLPPPSQAAPRNNISASYLQGVKSYSSHHYSEALSEFNAALKEHPNDTLTHYYLGLCYQALNQISSAKQHFQFVAESNNTRLKGQASLALQNLSHYKSTFIGAGAAPLVPGSKAKFRGRLRIYDFTATWCAPCQKFAPIFQSVSSSMGSKAQFSSLDIDDPGNSQLVKRFNITAVPTVVFTDDSGAELLKSQGAYDSESSFTQDVKNFF